MEGSASTIQLLFISMGRVIQAYNRLTKLILLLTV